MLARKLAFALDAARGIRFLHELTPPRMHRDIKSANLLVAEVRRCFRVLDLVIGSFHFS